MSQVAMMAGSVTSKATSDLPLDTRPQTPLLGAFDPLSERDFQYFALQLLRLTGIRLASHKLDLVQTRLFSHLLRKGWSSFSEYRQFLECGTAESIHWQEFTNLLTTNKTEFFREINHFDWMQRELIPQWRRDGKVVRIWSAACSTGEEPYSLAMLLQSEIPGQFEIFATDVDTSVLKHAQNGVYPRHRISEIPETFQQYLDLGRGTATPYFRVQNQIHQVVKFNQQNLLAPPEIDWKFDLILCRNVLIYFSPETVQSVGSHLTASLNPGGILMIGHADAFRPLPVGLQTMAPSTFALNRAGMAD